MSKTLLITLSIFVYQLLISIVDAQQINYAQRGCEGAYGNYTKRSVYDQNLNQLFTTFSSQSSIRKFYNSTIGSTPNQVYGLYQCREDLNLDLCKACIQAATRKIVQVCPFYGEAIVWYDECMLRYANRTIFSVYEISPRGFLWQQQNMSKDVQFIQVLLDTINGVINEATRNSSSVGHFGTGDKNFTLLDRVYCLAQCTPDIDNFGCNNCLKNALVVMNSCCRGSIYSKVFLPSCQLRYDLTQFYNVTLQVVPMTPHSDTPFSETGDEIYF